MRRNEKYMFNPKSLIEKNETVRNDSSQIIMNIRLRYARNLTEYPFPKELNEQDALTVWKNTIEVIKRNNNFSKELIIFLSDLTEIEKIFLVERRLISPDMLKCKNPCGVVASGDEKSIVLINEEDHLRISIKTTMSEHKSSFDNLCLMENYLNNNLHFAYMKEYGYLTSCPTNLGTAFRISGLFHLAGLVYLKKINKYLNLLEEKNFVIRGYYGEQSRFLGDIFQISTLNCDAEKNDLAKVMKIFNTIESDEKIARETISKSKNRLKYEDFIYRNFGVLQNARLLSFEEAISIFSVLMLGKSIGLDIPLSEDVIHRLMVNTQPAHIQMLAGAEMTADERDEFRAEYIRKAMKVSPV